VTQIQATVLKKKNEGMLVCIVQGATVLISRREKLNTIVLDFLAPLILWKNIGIACYVPKACGPPTGRDKDMVASKMCRKPRMACVQFFWNMGASHGILHRKKYQQ
jgi:hypothetical protein